MNQLPDCDTNNCSKLSLTPKSFTGLASSLLNVGMNDSKASEHRARKLELSPRRVVSVLNRWKKLVIGSLIAVQTLAEVSSARLLDPLADVLPSLSAVPLQLFTTFQWNVSPSQDVTGYALYYQVAGLPITNRVDVGKAVSFTLPLLVGSPHSVYVTAYTADGVESEPSNVVNYSPPPVTPLRISKLQNGLIQLQFRTSPLALCRVEWTPSLNPPVWHSLGLGLVGADWQGNIKIEDPDARNSPARFYRAAKF